MTKNAESLGTVYIYIVRFNKLQLCKRSRKTMFFRRI